MVEDQERGDRRLGGWLLLGLVCGIVLVYGLGLQNYVSLAVLARNHDALQELVIQHLLLAMLAYFAAYIAVAVFCIPGAAVLTIVGGYLFGWLVGTPLTLVAATTGALITFKIVKTALGEPLARRAGPYVKGLIQGFRANAFSYLLFLRLVPAFPFFAINAVAGLARIDLKTFLSATIIGMIPGSLVFGFVGSGLADTLHAAILAHAACVAEKSESLCPYDTAQIFLPRPLLLAAFLGLGILALLPVIWKKWKQ